MAYAHSRGIIHRDIKPANVIFNGEAKLADFGVVMEGKMSTNGGSTIAGTPGYMAPEQWLGQASERSDIYGIGTTLLYLLTGKNPETMQNHATVRFEDRFRLHYEEQVKHCEGGLQDILARKLILYDLDLGESLHLDDLDCDRGCLINLGESVWLP